ncbi:MAG: M24 family metallopeptidase, partial [Acidobacteria bacterium]|nr:M24 family metallopeptidase [Acidobacteriota bacterium]
RMVKSAAELAAIQHSIDVSIQAHRAAWRKLAPGRFEYQLAAAMAGVQLDAGCARAAYSPIVGSGPNSTALHYSRNSRRMDSGELVVIDAAAECDGYAADITRTLPANGAFTARQREIYNIVLGAQQAAIAAVKPGMLLSAKEGPASLYRLAYDYIDSHGKDREGRSLGRYFTHNIGHHVGLDVHDANVPGTALAENMVITIEPGIYIPEENLGVRIEDMVLVTSNGGKVLSSALPKEAEAVERALSAQGTRE